jgi:ATP-dependent DNA helicase RecG
MTYVDISNLLLKAKCCPSEELESESIEFKCYGSVQALHNSKDLAQEISAIANANGGIIIIGVKDSSDVPSEIWTAQMQGIPPIDELETQERIQGKLQPRIPITVANILFESRNYVVVRIPHRSDTLVSTSSGKTCIREGRSSRPMTPSEMENAVKSLTSYDWSAEPVEVDPIESLDSTALEEARKDFLERRSLTDELTNTAFLEAIGATYNGQLVKGGLLFLGKNDQIRKYLGDYEYRFSWKTSSGKLLTNDVWVGCLWHTVKRAKHHFNNCNSNTTFHYKDKEFTVPLLDPIAYHEAYLNALVHRDYTSEGMVSVTFAAQQIVITSPG